MRRTLPVRRNVSSLYSADEPPLYTEAYVPEDDAYMQLLFA
jgi:hypothetical protein